jgi:hypothetical protein
MCFSEPNDVCDPNLVVVAFWGCHSSAAKKTPAIELGLFRHTDSSRSMHPGLSIACHTRPRPMASAISAASPASHGGQATAVALRGHEFRQRWNHDVP